MKGVEKVSKDGRDYAIVVRASVTPTARYNFLTDPEQPMQLGINVYVGGDVIPAHEHLDIVVPECRIHEFLIIDKGRVRLQIYDDDREPVTEIVLETGDKVMFMAGGHGLEVLEPTTIVEVKQGPYREGADKVLYRAPGEGG